MAPLVHVWYTSSVKWVWRALSRAFYRFKHIFVCPAFMIRADYMTDLRRRRPLNRIWMYVGLLFVLVSLVPVVVHAVEPDNQETFPGMLNDGLWLSPPTVLGTLSERARVTVVSTSSGETHVVWEEGGRLYHTWRDVRRVWHSPRLVYYGTSPSLAVDPHGVVHMVFAQDVIGNFEIYHTVFNGTMWSLPTNVSHTRAHSYSPHIGVGPDGALHVVWTDRTGGQDRVYHAILQGQVWVDAPLPNAWGKSPTLEIDTRNVGHVIWQQRNIHGLWDVYHMSGISDVWQLPQNISDNSNANSVAPQAVVDREDWTHVVWLEDAATGPRLMYSVGRDQGWLWPQSLARGPVEDVSLSTSEQGMYIHVWWADTQGWWERWRASTAWRWSAPLQLAGFGVRHFSFIFSPHNGRRVDALWQVEGDDGQRMDLWYGEIRTPVVQRLYFAIMGLR